MATCVNTKYEKHKRKHMKAVGGICRRPACGAVHDKRAAGNITHSINHIQPYTVSFTQVRFAHVQGNRSQGKASSQLHAIRERTSKTCYIRKNKSMLHTFIFTQVSIALHAR